TKFAPAIADLFGFAKHIVVDIRHVLDILNIVTTMPQVPHQHIERQERKCMSKMGGVIWCNTADIEAHLVVIYDKILNLLGHRVVEPHVSSLQTGIVLQTSR